MNHFPSRTDSTYQFTHKNCIGFWRPATPHAAVTGKTLREALRSILLPLYLVQRDGELHPESDGVAVLGAKTDGGEPLAGYAPPSAPEDLGDPSFCRELGIRYPYLGGSMAKGISSAAISEELGRSGMLGFFGAAGLPLFEVESAIDRLTASMGHTPFGFNLIHSPHDSELERALAELYIKKGVCIIEASAFLDITLPLVRYRVHGIRRGADGGIIAPNRIIAKVSREELAAKFFSPPPDALLGELVFQGAITPEQAELAARIPLAQEVTAEADSGGHTDNRPAIALFPTMSSQAVRLKLKYGYDCALRVGLAGGISTPASSAAAFAMGAAYIMTGSVNQACIESGTSDAVRSILAETRQADVTMAPAADMFEMGITVQVLKRGTMFPMRAAKLYELYRSHGSLEDIPLIEREKLEKSLFQRSLEDVWRDTRTFFLARDPSQVERGDRDPRHRMALVFRWYLGQSAHWARDGAENRRIDYQVWCGPSMGAFNEWAAGSFLEEPSQRRVVTVALNILYGAALASRINFLRSQGVRLPEEAMRLEPLEIAQIKEYLF